MADQWSDKVDHMTANCTIYVEQCGTAFLMVGMVVFQPLICCHGVVFNILNLIVFTKRRFKMKDSFLILLTGLAMADLVVSVVSLPNGIIRCFPSHNKTLQYFLHIYEVYIYLCISNIFAVSSAWLTISVACERFLHLCYQPLAKTVYSPTRSKWIIALIFIMAFIFNLPLILSYTVTADYIAKNHFGDSIGYLVYQWIRMILAKFGPVIIVAILNTFIICFIWSEKKKNRTVIFPVAAQMRRQRTQNRLTTMLLSITFVFMFCNVLEPFSHSRLCPAVFGQCAQYDGTCHIISVLGNNFEFVAFASNFVSYCIFNTHFVQVLKTSLCRPQRETTVTESSESHGTRTIYTVHRC